VRAEDEVIAGNEAGNQDITGVHQNNENEENTTEVHEDTQGYEQTEYDDANDDEVSIESESNDDS